ncbi:MAG: DUF1554 domain-containing protein [Deltaproteobacteria bacterium]|nr:DUF1554 domain-containing protein [Deltaproteobacteria bacterium]
MRIPLIALAALLAACPAANDDDSSSNDDDAADDDDAANDDDSTEPGALRTFMAAAHTGNLGGPTGADALCTSDANNPDATATWKAMIGGLSRIPCADPDCASGTAGQADWVFAPDTEYLRPEGGTLFTTNSDGVFTAYPLGSNVMNSPQNFWTGLDSDWTVFAGEHCNDWNSDGVGVEGRVGWTESDSATWIQGGSVECDGMQQFLCVEQ